MSAPVARPASPVRPDEPLLLNIGGMSCAACAGRVERALRAVPGVQAADVQPATAQARVQAGPRPDTAALVAAVQAAGYSVATLTHDLQLSGLSCAACSGRVEKALAAQAGVLQASVNLATERARVQALAGLSRGALVAAVEGAGYGVLDPLGPVAPGDAAAVFDPAGIADPGGRGDTEPPAARAAARRDTALTLLALLLAAPLVLPMLLLPLGLHLMPPAGLQWALATAVQFGPGLRFYRAGAAALRAGSGSMDLLVALGSSAAWGLSTVLWLQGETQALYFESAAVIIALVRLGKGLETRAKRRTAQALRGLAALRPVHATVLGADGVERRRPVETLAVGEHIVVKPGERLPVDGEVLAGDSHLDTAALSGESLPRATGPGERVQAGAINGEGRLLLRATAVGAETTLARIVRLVETAQAAKPPVQRLVDRISAVFVPAVVALALLTGLGGLLAGLAPAAALMNAVAVLVVACPCALGLATPMALLAGTGAAARQGILIRDLQALETAPRIDTVAFDKTGTLTEGRPTLQALLPAAGVDPQALLRDAAALQQGSEHPLARAVLARAREQGLDLPPVPDLQALPGRGLRGSVDGRVLQLGSPRLREELGADPGPLAERGEALAAEGRSLAWLLATPPEGPARVLGLLAFGDRLRPGAAAAIASLRARGLHTVLLTGDHPAAARSVAAQLGLDALHAGLLPADKAELVRALRAQGHRVAMVGDGINDAPALAAADLGLAMGGGTDVARETAGLTLMHGDPRRVADAFDIARRTRAALAQNLAWAFGYNVVALPLAAFGHLSPALAGTAMALSSLGVVGNALRLARWRPASGASPVERPTPGPSPLAPPAAVPPASEGKA